jgi:hypothetical protein
VRQQTTDSKTAVSERVNIYSEKKGIPFAPRVYLLFLVENAYNDQEEKHTGQFYLENFPDHSKFRLLAQCLSSWIRFRIPKPDPDPGAN